MHYSCDVCGVSYDTIEKAQACEDLHKQLKERVVLLYNVNTGELTRDVRSWTSAPDQSERCVKAYSDNFFSIYGPTDEEQEMEEQLVSVVKADLRVRLARLREQLEVLEDKTYTKKEFMTHER